MRPAVTPTAQDKGLAVARAIADVAGHGVAVLCRATSTIVMVAYSTPGTRVGTAFR